MTEHRLVRCDNPGCDASADPDCDDYDRWLSVSFELGAWEDDEEREPVEVDVCSVGCLTPAIEWVLLDSGATS